MNRPISNLDLSFYYVTGPTTPQTICGLFKLEGFVAPQLIRSRLASLIEIFPRLQYQADVKTKKWRLDPEFSIDKHLLVTKNCKSSTEKFAEAMATELAADRPPWSLNVLYGSNSSTTDLLFSFHHSLGDGIGTMAFILSFFDESAERSSDPAASLTHAFDRLPAQAPRLKLFPRMKKLIADALSPRDQSPLVGENSSSRSVRLFDIESSDVKQLRLKLGCTSNDMILAALSHSLSKYFLRKEQKIGIDAVHAIIPFNRRTSRQITDLSNYLAGMSIALPLDEPELVKMAKRIGSRLTAAKFSGEYGAYGLLAEINAMLPNTMRPRLARYASSRTSMICTNVPGHRSGLFLGGVPLQSGYGSAALMPGHGLAFSVINMGKKLCCCLLTDPAIIPDGEEIADEFRKVFTTNNQDQPIRTERLNHAG
jgi:WS/DGAT/MGAT family acyltransferase